MGEEKVFRVRAVTLQNQRAFYEERTSSDLNSFLDQHIKYTSDQDGLFELVILNFIFKWYNWSNFQLLTA
jgi:hypothetical protein